MEKKNVITSFRKLDEDLIQQIEEQYPEGVEHLVKKYNMGPGKSFYAFPFTTKTCNYLVKVDVTFDASLDLSMETEAAADPIF